MLNIKIKFTFLLIILIIFSCKEKKSKSKFGCIESKWVESPVQAMTFSFISNSLFYDLMDIDSTKDTISIAGYQKNLIYYKVNNNKFFLDYIILTRKLGGKNAQYFISTGSVLSKSHSENIKQFYIDWPNGQIDSLYVDYLYDKNRDNPCCCQYPLQSLKLNNKSYISKDNYDNYGVYIFER